MPAPWNLLLVEDDAAMAEMLESWLRQTVRGPASLCHVATLADALQRLGQLRFDLILLDLNLPDSRQLHTLEAIVRRCPEVAVVVLTGLVDEDLMLAAVDAGAQDFIAKSDLDPRHLWERLRLAYARHQRQRSLFAQLAEVTRTLQAQVPPA